MDEPARGTIELDPKIGDVVMLRYSERSYLVEAVEQSGLLRLREMYVPKPDSLYARRDAVIRVIRAMEEAPQSEPGSVAEALDEIQDAIQDAQAALDSLRALLEP